MSAAVALDNGSFALNASEGASRQMPLPPPRMGTTGVLILSVKQQADLLISPVKQPRKQSVGRFGRLKEQTAFPVVLCQNPWGVNEAVASTLAVTRALSG